MPKPSVPAAVKLFHCHKCDKHRNQTLAYEMRDWDGVIVVEYWKCWVCSSYNEIRFR